MEAARALFCPFLRAYFATEAAGPASRKVGRFGPRGRIKMDVYSAEPDALRRKAESEKQMGGAPPEASGSVLRIQNAAVSRSEKSPVLTST